MPEEDARAWLILATVVLAPVTLVLLTALIRGYDLTIVFRRHRGRGRRDDDD